MEVVERVAEAVLYEGYLLYPYRKSALKNQMRWTFGGVYPSDFSESTGGDDPCLMQTECLVVQSPETRINVKVRFLQVVDRRIVKQSGPLATPVDELRVDGRLYTPWEEAMEREVVRSFRMTDLLEQAHNLPIAVDAGASETPIAKADGSVVGVTVREWSALSGLVAISADDLDGHSIRVTVKITNDTPAVAVDRACALRRAFISTHTILQVTDGEFVSLLEPGPEYKAAAESCKNVKTWPVLVGDTGERHTLLSSPIILYDYPQISPESPGDLFDGTEIDELLRFSILTLTDDEKREMRESDERGRAILESTEALTPAQLMKLHASVRAVQTLRGPMQ